MPGATGYVEKIEDFVEDAAYLGRRTYPNKTDLVWEVPLPMEATEQYVLAKRETAC